MIVLLFGLAGAGKEFCWGIISRIFPEWHFWDADEALTEDMLFAIQENRSFSQVHA